MGALPRESSNRLTGRPTMRTSTTPLATIPLVLALALAACGGGSNADDEAAPVDSATADTVTAEGGGAGATTAGLEVGGTLAEVTVTNPMPHAMTVTVEFEGGGAHELGTIPASGSQSFSLAASPGETVRLVATDADSTHSPSTRMELAETNAWTIGN